MGLEIATDKDAGFFLSIIGIASTIGRLVFGYLSDHSFINRLWLYSGSLTVCGIVTMFSSLARSYNLMIIYCAAYGITCGNSFYCILQQSFLKQFTKINFLF